MTDESRQHQRGNTVLQQKLIDAEYQLILSTFEAKQAEIGLIRMSGDFLQLVNW